MRRIVPSLRFTGAGLAVAVTVVLTSLSQAASATPAPVHYATTTDRVEAAAGWLAGQFVNSTHLPAPSGDHFDSSYGGTYYPLYGQNADVIFGLAAAKSGGTKIATALDYLAAHVDDYADVANTDGYGPYDGAVAKLALAAIVGGRDPHSFGGKDLISTLKHDECPAGSTTCTPGSAANIYSSISESLVVLAEVRAGSTAAPSPAALNYFTSLQCASGAFPSGVQPCKAGDEDTDATSYAIMALQAAGGHQAALDSAVAWLKKQQAAGGYWVTQQIPNVNSTGLAAAALQGVGADVTAARAWLRSQQVPAGTVGAGAFRYAGSVVATTKSATSPSVIATAQALTGLIDGSSLATLTAAGATDGVAVYAPKARAATSAQRPGSTQSVTGTGFAPAEQVRVELHSTARTVATVTADALGSVRASYVLPSGTAAGTHTLTLTGLTSGLSAGQTITVSPVPSPTSTAGSPSSTGAPSSSTARGVDAQSVDSLPGTGSGLAATGIDSRQVTALTLVGIGALLAGFALLVIGRRRAH